MKLKLPNSIISTQDLNQLILEIHGYVRWHNHESVKKQATADEQAGVEDRQPSGFSTEAQEMLRNWHGKKTPTPKTLDQLIDELEDFKDSAPRVVITLAAPAGPKQKKHLAGWCREHLRSDILVDFEFDSNLLGGMIVRCGSHIYDWSFRRQILQNSRHFPEVLRRV